MQVCTSDNGSFARLDEQHHIKSIQSHAEVFSHAARHGDKGVIIMSFNSEAGEWERTRHVLERLDYNRGLFSGTYPLILSDQISLSFKMGSHIRLILPVPTQPTSIACDKYFKIVYILGETMICWNCQNCIHANRPSGLGIFSKSLLPRYHTYIRQCCIPSYNFQGNICLQYVCYCALIQTDGRNNKTCDRMLSHGEIAILAKASYYNT